MIGGLRLILNGDSARNKCAANRVSATPLLVTSVGGPGIAVAR